MQTWCLSFFVLSFIDRYFKGIARAVNNLSSICFSVLGLVLQQTLFHKVSEDGLDWKNLVTLRSIQKKKKRKMIIERRTHSNATLDGSLSSLEVNLRVDRGLIRRGDSSEIC